jgi:hypothetical protein
VPGAADDHTDPAERSAHLLILPVLSEPSRNLQSEISLADDEAKDPYGEGEHTMSRRSAAIVAAGLTASLVIGVLAFVLGVLGPDPSAVPRVRVGKAIGRTAQTAAHTGANAGTIHNDVQGHG